jgi:predicted ester cyclase
VSTEQTRALAREVYAAINARDDVALERLFDPQIVRHAAGEVGIEAAKAAMAAAFAEFPDTRFVVQDVIAEGDRAALRVTVHRGDPASTPPRSLILEVFRVAAGRVVEIWGAGLPLTPAE